MIWVSVANYLINPAVRRKRGARVELVPVERQQKLVLRVSIQQPKRYTHPFLPFTSSGLLLYCNFFSVFYLFVVLFFFVLFVLMFVFAQEV